MASQVRLGSRPGRLQLGAGAGTPVRHRPVRPWAWVVLVCGLVLTAVGWSLGWEELAAPGAVLLVVFGFGLAASLGQVSYDVGFAVNHRRVEIGAKATVVVTVQNIGPRRTWPGLLHLPVGPGRPTSASYLRSGAAAHFTGRRPIRVPALAPGDTAKLEVDLPTNRRALLAVGPAEAVRGDPFGLVVRRRTWGQPVTVAVYPSSLRLPVALAGLIRDVDGRPTGQPAEANCTFHALRTYQPGDDRRTIHWRSSWRLGQLMVRQSEDIRRVQMVLVASTAIEQFGGTGDFELAAGAASSLALSQLDQAGSVTVVANGVTVRARPALRGTVLDLVAGLVVRPAEQGGETLATAAARARRDAPAVTLAILVTGVKPTLPALRAVTGYLPGQAWALAIRCQVGAATEVSQVGRLALATIGSLEALPKALRQLKVVG